MVMIQLLLPTTGAASSDGRPLLAETRREFAIPGRHGMRPITGLWTAADGHTDADDVVMVEVVTETFDRTWWRTYAVTLAQRFRQDTIHVRALSVEMPDEEDS
jgi:hypothetical protein